MKRICVKCGDRLKDQRTYHTSSKEQKHGTWRSHWCDGPKNTPGARSRISRSPIHYRDFAGPGTTICGLQGGRTKGKYKNNNADVTWGRIKVDLSQTTCEHCLIAIIKRSKQVLRTRLKAIGKSGLTAFREQRSVATVQGLKKLVNA